MGHVCRMNDERLPKRQLLGERHANWKCLLKAPRKQGKVLADLKPLHFVRWNDIVNATKNRKQWRGIVRDSYEAATSQSGSML